MSEKNHPFFNNPVIAYAHHKILVDMDGNPYDYEYLEVNPVFEKLTGLKASEIVGKTATFVLKDAEENISKLISCFGDIALHGGEIEYEQYNKYNKRWYHVHVYSVVKMTFTSIFSDITRRKEMDEQLTESQLKYEELADSITDIYFAMDENLAYTYWNKASEQFTGLSAGNAIGKSMTEIFPETPDNIKAKNIYLEVMRTKQAKSFINEFHAENQILYFEINAYPAKKGVSVFVKDITENKRLERLQQETTQRLLYANKATNDVIWDWDVETDTQQWNEAGTKVFGWTEIVEHPVSAAWWVERVHPDDRNRIHNSFFKVVNDPIQNIWQDEYLFLKTDGSYASVVDRGYVIRDEKGKAIRMIGAMQDVTIHHQTIIKICESEKRYHELSTLLRLLADNMPDMLWAKNLKKEYIFANKAICEQLLSASDTNEPLGKTDLFFAMRERNAHPDNPEWHTFGEICRDSDSITLDEMKAMQFDEYGNIKGKFLYLDVHKAPLLDDEGKVIGVVGSARDVTAEKQAEEEKEKLQNQLAQAQKMESVGRLAGGVAHDFNNMLSVILGHTELALLSMEKTDKLYGDLQDIQNAAQRSADLTRQLLAFARKQTIQPKKIDLNEIVDDMLKMLRRLIGEDIELIWEPKAILWPVWLDPTQLDQILANLCVNARDAISGVGKITIKTDNVVFDDDFCITNKMLKPGDYVCLSVNDTGCGMDDDTISHLFEPFFTTKAKDYGSGLGLATVYGIVKQNYGFIHVESKVSEGTTFKIYFPCHRDEKVMKQEKNYQQTLTYGNGSILLVEDEPAILRMTATMLSKIGYSVLSASGPREAIRLAGEHSGSIDLLLTDVIMPEMNGYDLVKKVSELYPAVKTVFMSGYTADIISQRGIIDEGVHFIQKPFSIADLSAKIREVLGS